MRSIIPEIGSDGYVDNKKRFPDHDDIPYQLCFLKIRNKNTKASLERKASAIPFKAVVENKNSNKKR